MAKKRKNGSEGIVENICREKLSPITHWLSTGCTLLDIAVADRFPGGVPGGRVIHIVGGESSAKTLFAQTILGAAQRLGGIAYYDDSEASLDFSRADLFGLDVGRAKNEMIEPPYISENGNFIYDRSENVEEFFDVFVKKALEREDSEIPAAGVCDSLSALPSVKELDEKLSDNKYGTIRAKRISEAFRKFTIPISKKNLTLVFIDQTRANIGVVFGDKETFGGGKALRFYASVRIRLKVIGKVKNKREVISGVKIHFKVDKNKVAPPFREGDFELSFDYGIEDAKSNLEFLHENINLTDGMEIKKGVGWVYGDKKIGTDVKMVEFVEQEGLEEEIRGRVWDVWQKLYEIPARKAREWK